MTDKMTIYRPTAVKGLRSTQIYLNKLLNLKINRALMNVTSTMLFASLIYSIRSTIFDGYVRFK